jgi:hypothetical protein
VHLSKKVLRAITNVRAARGSIRAAEKIFVWP